MGAGHNRGWNGNAFFDVGSGMPFLREHAEGKAKDADTDVWYPLAVTLHISEYSQRN